MDDGNQLCNYVVSYLQLSAETIWPSVLQYILHNMGEITEFSKNFDENDYFRQIYFNFKRTKSLMNFQFVY